MRERHTHTQREREREREFNSHGDKDKGILGLATVSSNLLAFFSSQCYYDHQEETE